MSTADDLNQAIINAATKAKTVSADGQSITRPSVPEVVAAQQAVAANETVKNIGNGKWPFRAMRINPPGAGGY